MSTKVTGFIEKANGQVLAFEEWGRRKLAAIAKNEHGIFNYINFVAPADAPISIERALGPDDSFMRYITVQLEKNVDVDAAPRPLRPTRLSVMLRAAEEEAARAAAEAEAEGPPPPLLPLLPVKPLLPRMPLLQRPPQGLLRVRRPAGLAVTTSAEHSDANERKNQRKE